MCEELLKDPLTKKETPRLVPYYEEFLQLAFRCYQQVKDVTMQL